MKKRKGIMILITITLLILVIILVVNDSHIKDSQKESSNDFNFRLNFSINGREQIDTYNGTYTKDLVLAGTETIDFILPDDVKNDIYKLMKDINIMSYPETLINSGLFITPSCNYKLTVTMEGTTKTITWDDALYHLMGDKTSIQNANFLKIVKLASDYIYSTDEYKNMPAAEGAYQ